MLKQNIERVRKEQERSRDKETERMSMHVNKKMSFESLKPSHIIHVGGAGGVAW